MTSELLPGLALMVLLALISGRSTATRLFGFSWLSGKICVMTWSPRVAAVADRHGAGLQLGVGLGHDLQQAAVLHHREAQAAQRRQVVEVGLAHRQRLVAVQRDRALDPRIDGDLAFDHRGHGARHRLDIGVDEIHRHRRARLQCRAVAVGGATCVAARRPLLAGRRRSLPCRPTRRRRRSAGRSIAQGARRPNVSAWSDVLACGRHAHPIAMTDSAPWRRPMMFRQVGQRVLLAAVGAAFAPEAQGPSRSTGPGPSGAAALRWW